MYFIRDILLWLFVSLLIMAILDPFVTRLEKFKVPRGFSIILTYIIFLALVIIAVAGIIPPLVEQTTVLVNSIPRILDTIGASTIYGEQILNEILSFAGTLPSHLAKFSVEAISNVVGVIFVLMLAFYLLMAKNRLDANSEAFLGKKMSQEIARILKILEKKLGGWVIGQASLMFLVGISTYIGLTLLGIPFALSLAILAGLLEIIPFIGPIIAAIPAVIIGFGISPLMGLAVAALTFLVQQLENYIFVPKVMEKTVEVSPIITILVLAIGFKLAGVLGVVISVPAVITVRIIAKEYFHAKGV